MDSSYIAQQRGTAGAEIKDPSVENPELQRSPFIARSRSVYSHVCYAYCMGFLPRSYLPSRYIHLHFSPKTLPSFFLCWLWLTSIPVWASRIKQVTLLIVTHCWFRFPCWIYAEYRYAPKHFYCINGLAFRNCEHNFDFTRDWFFL